MDKKFVCEVPELEAKRFLDIFEMKNALESLAIQIAGNNDIIERR